MKKIYRLWIGDKRKKVVGEQLVEGTSVKSILKQPKSKYVGSGRTILGITPTRFKGTLKQRLAMPRSRRFGKLKSVI